MATETGIFKNFASICPLALSIDIKRRLAISGSERQWFLLVNSFHSTLSFMFFGLAEFLALFSSWSTLSHTAAPERFPAVSFGSQFCPQHYLKSSCGELAMGCPLRHISNTNLVILAYEILDDRDYLINQFRHRLTLLVCRS